MVQYDADHLYAVLDHRRSLVVFGLQKELRNAISRILGATVRSLVGKAISCILGATCVHSSAAQSNLPRHVRSLVGKELRKAISRILQ